MPRWRGSAARVGLDQQREALALDAVRDPGLGAVDDVVRRRRGPRAVRIACRSVPQSGSVSARPPRSSPRGEARQEAALLLLGAEALHGGRHDQVRVEDAGQRHPDGGDRVDDPGVGRRRQAEPAVFRRDRRAEQAERLHLLDHLRGVDVVVLELAAPAGRTSRSSKRSIASRIWRSSSSVNALIRLTELGVGDLVVDAWPRLGISIVRLKLHDHRAVGLVRAGRER